MSLREFDLWNGRALGVEARDRFWLLNPEQFFHFRYLREASFFALAAVMLERDDPSFERAPNGLLDLRKNRPSILLDACPNAPWRAGALHGEGKNILFLGDPAFDEMVPRAAWGASAKAPSSAWAAELPMLEGKARQAWERALAQGLLDVEGLVLPNRKRMRVPPDMFRAPLSIKPLQDTVIVGNIHVTAIKVRIAHWLRPDAPSSTSAPDHAPQLAIPEDGPRDLDALAHEVAKMWRSGIRPADAARQLIRIGKLSSRKLDADPRSLIRPVIVRFYQLYPEAKRKRR